MNTIAPFDLSVYTSYHTTGKQFGTAISMYMSSNTTDKFEIRKRYYKDRTYLSATLTALTELLGKGLKNSPLVPFNVYLHMNMANQTIIQSLRKCRAIAVETFEVVDEDFEYALRSRMRKKNRTFPLSMEEQCELVRTIRKLLNHCKAFNIEIVPTSSNDPRMRMSITTSRDVFEEHKPKVELVTTDCLSDLMNNFTDE